MQYPTESLRVVIMSSDCSVLVVGPVIHMETSTVEENVIVVGVKEKEGVVEKYFKMYHADTKVQTEMGWEIKTRNCYDYDSVHPVLGKQNFHFYIPKAI